MSAPTMSLVAGDRSRPFAEQLLDELGNMVDLTGCTLVFRMAIQDGVSPIISGAAGISGPATLGNFTYSWGPTDTLVPGIYFAEVAVTKAGVTATYPPENPWVVEIRPEV